MTRAEDILLFILGATLALFLVLSITVVIMIIVLIRRLQTVATKAENLVDTAGDIGQTLRKTFGSFSFFQAASGLVSALAKLRGKTNDE